MNTLRSVAIELRIDYYRLRRLVKQGRIPGVSVPPMGQWHFLTHEERECIRVFCEARQKKTGSES